MSSFAFRLLNPEPGVVRPRPAARSRPFLPCRNHDAPKVGVGYALTPFIYHRLPVVGNRTTPVSLIGERRANKKWRAQMDATEEDRRMASPTRFVPQSCKPEPLRTTAVLRSTSRGWDNRGRTDPSFNGRIIPSFSNKAVAMPLGAVTQVGRGSPIHNNRKGSLCSPLPEGLVSHPIHGD